MPRLADGDAGSEAQDGPVGVKMQGINVEHLHGQFGRTNLEGQTGVGIERDAAFPRIPRNLPTVMNSCSPSGAKVFDLQNCLAPCVGIAAAIERAERSGLDLSNVIALPDRSATIVDHKRLLGMGFEHGKDRA